MDPTQILLFSVVTILTALLVVIGIQVFFILKELRRVIRKLDQILDDVSYVSSSVTKPIAGITTFLEGIKGIRDVIDLVSEKAPRKALSEGREERGEGASEIEDLRERGRRFFHKDGKPLTS